MTDSLRDQLLGLGFKPEAKPQPRPARAKAERKPPSSARKQASKRGGNKARSTRDGGEMDLAKAYAIRAQKEKNERVEAERAKQEAARLRREARMKVKTLLDGRTLNDASAEIARHFEYGGKIKRIYVTTEQLEALNAGKLGVLQQEGRYLLVDAALLAQAETIFPQAVALKVDPDAAVESDPYADPQFQVPDDLVW